MKVVREHNGKYYLTEYDAPHGWYAAEISYEAFKLLEHLDSFKDFYSVDWIKDEEDE
ncbi:hypothetical protein [Bacillus toyonensis]|uniref:hypothetical protein n=1 Tax=Bacillus toyonensis TaxID=155322 RepID=UPI0015D4E33F|nr:hypothetical protein [Bacillus toyonensis]